MAEDRLILKSQLAELTRLHDWLEALGAQHAIPANTLFAMDLCLEEAVSNVIRHGYASAEDRPITVRLVFEPAPLDRNSAGNREHSSPQEDHFVLMIEDQAPAFNPLDFPEPGAPALEDIRVGGRGIQLLRKFSHALEYQRLPEGNRLRIDFLAARPKLAVD